MTKTLRALLALSILALVAIAAAGCGSSSSGAGADPASVVPDSSIVYAEVTIDPTGSQEAAMRSILADLPGSGAPEARLENLIRDAARKDKENKLDYDKDVKPWLGDRAGVFIAGNPAALASGGAAWAAVIATTDEGAAHDAIEKDKDSTAAHKNYRGVEYVVESDDGDLTAEGVVDGFFVSGSDAGMKAAIDASKSKTLAQDDRFKKAVGAVPDEHIAFVYVDLREILQLVQDQAGSVFPGGALLGRLFASTPLVITARAENQALVFEGSGFPSNPLTKSNGQDPTPLMASLPGDSWAALAAPGFGDGIRAALPLFTGPLGGEQALNDQVRAATGLDLQDDLLGWIGDVAIFAQGDTKDTIGGGLLIKSKDSAKSKQALTKIAAAITRLEEGTTVAAAKIPGAFGYSFKSSDVPQRIFAVQAGDKVAITYGEAAAKAVIEAGGLTDSGGYKRAASGLGDAYRPALYVSVPPILTLANSAGASGKDWDQAKPYLTILDYLIAGSAQVEGQSHSRFRIGFKPHE
jgi:hypothetical protein